jgi:LacI family transcriptional regulator, galactose operon repressor
MQVTIREVAKQLNLSITTISRALDGYDDVSEATRKLVVKTAEEMGYSPNRAARQLRRQRTDTIGYILPSNKPRFADPFFSEFLSGLGDAAASLNYDLLISTAPADHETEQKIYQRWVHAHKVDGFVINRVRLYDWRIQYLSYQQVPLVTLERSLDELEHPSIEVDGFNGFQTLVTHLVEKGFRRIAYIGASQDLKIQVNRLNGYMTGLTRAGIQPDPALIEEGNLTRQGGYLAAKRLLSLEKPPVAIACVNDLTAIGAMEIAHERGLVVGKDLAVVGFDGIEEAAHTQSPLTTLYQPLYEISRELVQMLVTLIVGDPLPQAHIVYTPQLVIRASTGG